MFQFLRLSILLLAICIYSCKPTKPCSGLNPEIGKYNTSQKIRKGKRSLHSTPEKEAYRRRSKQLKHKKSRGGKAGAGGSSGIHIFSSGFSASAHVSGHASVNKQKN
ncbi:hypothetical protein BH09BAC5_BH09BAC5_01160 [soil metagenome]